MYQPWKDFVLIGRESVQADTDGSLVNRCILDMSSVDTTRGETQSKASLVSHTKSQTEVDRVRVASPHRIQASCWELSQCQPREL